MGLRTARMTLGLVAVTIIMASCGTVRAEEAAVRIDAAKVLHTGNRRMLIGSNVALWNAQETFSTPELHGWLEDLRIGLIRMPGGSWSDITYWNGNGVRGADGSIDPSRMKDGFPAVDYGDYAPSIIVGGRREVSTREVTDVKTVHEFIRSIPGCETLVCVNAGTGRALDAAEWVRWANKVMGYNVRYWEVGNELAGSWEAGHVLPDGTELTGEIYAERYRQFAQAMKAVDPTIKVGCMDWLPDVLSHCGELVDFVSWHTYPLRSTMSRQEMMAVPERDLARIATDTRELIRRYQPDREDEIELGVSEWNLGLEGGMEVDTFGAIWTSVFVGEMLRNGVDFANQWDAFTHNAGGSLIFSQQPYLRKAQYWAFWLWSHYMGDGLLECSVDGPDWLRAFATRSEDVVCLMAINSSEDEEAVLQVRTEGFRPAAEGETALLSHRECFWDQQANRPLWSSEPQADPIAVGPAFSVNVPPMSVKCVRIPSADKPGISARAERRRGMEGKDFGAAELRVILPPSGYEDTQMKGWVLAFFPGTEDPYPAPLPNARIAVSGPAAADRAEVRLSEAAGPFTLRPTGPGKAVVTASLGEQAATAEVALQKSEPRPQVLWDFETESLGRGYRSHWQLSTDDSIRPNQRVARIDVPGVIPDQEHRELLVISDFPRGAGLRRENIRGVFFDVAVSRDFQCEDPDASIEIVMQSPADYWMALGSVPLPKAGDRWQTQTVMVTNAKHIEAMPAAYNVWFVLHAQKPVNGAVFIDHAGLMVR